MIIRTGLRHQANVTTTDPTDATFWYEQRPDLQATEFRNLQVDAVTSGDTSETTSTSLNEVRAHQRVSSSDSSSQLEVITSWQQVTDEVPYETSEIARHQDGDKDMAGQKELTSPSSGKTLIEHVFYFLSSNSNVVVDKDP